MFQLEYKKDASSSELQQYCQSQPVVVIRGMASALKLGRYTVIVCLMDQFYADFNTSWYTCTLLQLQWGLLVYIHCVITEE